jgi:RNA polymerase sigma-70 factor (ECF subfamily)
MRTRTRFEALALPHLTMVYRLACQLAGPDRADDLVQETFLRAWAHFHQFDPHTNCRAWLCRILRNTWISEWRKTRLELPVADVDEAAAEYTWEPEAIRSDLSVDMAWALGQLPETYRWAVLLADVEELTYQEIALTMDCPVGTVMSRISRGRRLLAQRLRERSGERVVPMKVVAREG